jgi:hypothetical protein
MKWWDMENLWERGEVHTEFWWGDLNDRNYLEDLDVDGRVLLNCIFKMCDEGAWTGLMCLGIRRVDGLQLLQ